MTSRTSYTSSIVAALLLLAAPCSAQQLNGEAYVTIASNSRSATVAPGGNPDVMLQFQRIDTSDYMIAEMLPNPSVPYYKVMGEVNCIKVIDNNSVVLVSGKIRATGLDSSMPSGSPFQTDQDFLTAVRITNQGEPDEVAEVINLSTSYELQNFNGATACDNFDETNYQDSLTFAPTHSGNYTLS